MLKKLLRFIDLACGLDEPFCEEDFDLCNRRWQYEQQFAKRTAKELRELRESRSYKMDKAFKVAIDYLIHEKEWMAKERNRAGIRLVIDNT